MCERDHQSSAELILHNFNAHGVLLCECGYKAMPMDELALHQHIKRSVLDGK